MRLTDNRTPASASETELDRLTRVQARVGEGYALFMLSTRGTILSWNPGVQRILGYSEVDFMGRPVAELFTPEDRANEVPAQELSAAARNGYAEDARWYIHKDGRGVFVDGVVTALYEDGVLIGFSKLMRDATERHHTQERLRAKRERLEQVAEVLALAPAIVRKLDGTILFWNQGLSHMYGWSNEEAVGRISHELLRTEFPEPLQQINDILLREGHWHGELKHTSMSGSVIHVVSQWLLRRDAAGDPVSVTEINNDISERIRSEEALRDSEAKVRALLENASQAIIAVNGKGTIEQVNGMTEQLFGYTREELVGSPLERLLPERFRQTDHRRSEYFKDPRTPPMGFGMELAGLRKDGTEFPVEISLSHGGANNRAVAVAFVSDITTRKSADAAIQQANIALRRSNEELEEFAHTVSHDLQEPLRMVGSYTKLLAKRYKGRLDKDADEFIDYTLDATNRMQGLIRDLLAYSRVTSGSNTSTESVSSDSAMRQAIANLQVPIEESGAVITYDALPTVNAHASQLVQLFQNLIGNAVKYRAERTPTIHISTEQRDAEWVFSVKDNGIGFDPSYRERIFGIFKRLHRTEYPGTGIGLAICERIVQRHGGKIWADSTPGEGSTFSFTLPVVS